MINWSKVSKLETPDGLVKRILIGDTLVWKSSGYTNLVPFAIDTDGSIYNGTGFMDGWRLNSSAVPTQYATACHTGYIPCRKGQILRILGNTSTINNAGNYLACYDSNFTLLKCWVLTAINTAYYTYTDDNGDGLYLYKLDTGAIPESHGFFPQNTAYIRISHGNCRGVNLIVTLDEEITD